jgi:hypothetical protein
MKYRLKDDARQIAEKWDLGPSVIAEIAGCAGSIKDTRGHIWPYDAGSYVITSPKKHACSISKSLFEAAYELDDKATQRRMIELTDLDDNYPGRLMLQLQITSGGIGINHMDANDDDAKEFDIYLELLQGKPTLRVWIKDTGGDPVHTIELPRL